MLHLSGYDLTLEDLKQFRQLHSKTPGHPENHVTKGIEVTTGPLGQGLANAVGMSIAYEHARAMFNKDDYQLFDSYTFVMCGDGCLMEGITSEACSLAGHLGLGNLILMYDDNKVTIDGETELSFSEDVRLRFESYHWHTQVVDDGDHDTKSIEDAINTAKSVKDKPSIIIVKTTIGFLSKNQGLEKVHGSPLGADDIAAIKQKLGFKTDEFFHVPHDVHQFWQSQVATRSEAEQKWNGLYDRYKRDYPAEGALLDRLLVHGLPEDWKNHLPVFPFGKADATRNTSGKVLNALHAILPELIGGSADLTPSNKTKLEKSGDFSKHSRIGAYLRFGVREHAMFAICTGIRAYGLFLPFSATFLNFVSYGFGAVRLAALSEYQQICVATHDSIGLGEDGPTHQPVEVLSMLRATPNVLLFRPADGNETTGSYICAVEHRYGPSVLCLSRQNLPFLANSTPAKVQRGAYVLEDAKEGTPEIIFIATGSEVSIALDAASLIPLKARVVSAPCLELFKSQPLEYRRETLPIGIPVVSIEASGGLGWEKYSHHSVAMPAFGLSAPYEKLYEEFGFTGPKVAEAATAFIAKARLISNSFGPLRIHYE